MGVNLFCLPHAGGNGFSYKPLDRVTGGFINIIPLDYPGHGSRITEPLPQSIDEAADAVFDEMKGMLDAPYAILGHSMGTMTGYRVVRRIVEESLPLPLHLFFTGRGAPFVPSVEPAKHLMPRHDFRDTLARMGGISEEALNNEQLFEFIEPIIRSDFKAVETYRHSEGEPFNIPITVMLGNGDSIKVSEAELWQELTTRKLEMHNIEGGHFFIFDRMNEVGGIITSTLREAS